MSTLTGRDLLLLDEPYQGFDHGTYVNLWEQLRRLRDEGVAIVVVTHLLNELDRVDVVLDDRPGGRPMNRLLTVAEMTLRELRPAAGGDSPLLLLMPLSFYLIRRDAYVGQSVRSLLLGIGWAVSTAALFATAAPASWSPGCGWPATARTPLPRSAMWTVDTGAAAGHAVLPARSGFANRPRDGFRRRNGGGDRQARSVISDEQLIRAALAAAAAADPRDVPIGAVVVDAAGVELARAANAREERGDPTAHAEILALRAAAGCSVTAGGWGATLAVTVEPCTMCAGALVLARVSRLVFGAGSRRRARWVAVGRRS